MTPARSILVAGVGNLLMTDDGLGCHLAAALKDGVPPGVHVVDVGTSVIHLLDELEKADAVLFLDAFFGGGVPGSMYLVDARELLVPRTHASLHDVGIASALRELEPCHLQKPLLLFGVEPEHVDYGMELSPTLHREFPVILEAVQGILARLANGTTSPSFLSNSPLELSASTPSLESSP